MDVLLGIIALVLIVALLTVALGALTLAGIAAFTFLPALLGLVAGIWVWVAGHDNIGMLIIASGFIAQFFWSKRLSEGSSGPGHTSMSTKAKIYGKSGDVVGYVDKD